jgi:hypothetical protein
LSLSLWHPPLIYGAVVCTTPWRISCPQRCGKPCWRVAEEAGCPRAARPGRLLVAARPGGRAAAVRPSLPAVYARWCATRGWHSADTTSSPTFSTSSFRSYFKRGPCSKLDPPESGLVGQAVMARYGMRISDG